ncbi:MULTISPECIES: sigma-70 family RNA polymerase sigma factor [Desulfitobacterium]|uniref:RNA polymerase sigma factor, sigma-70 family n=1 Tax=Desulfitobacterium dehalogenans (strain ATCC 51507 / DSM 9161 / JW/IU-DC1) TaxID=756499 RepID=I4A9H6_DESDJ|nr:MULTISPECIES: sigma-70 family RNA polymerase sigma factor [Desulfitobacterium]AFM00611.1 RNA polymerase sigma factor, sigma-70 family [Desulfitobacterium dehalogenans ATCC 51507]
MASHGTLLTDIDAQLEAARSGNQDSLNWLIEYYEPEIRKIAYKYFLHRAEYDDLLQEGRIAIYKAIVSYNPTSEIPFLHFLRMVIKRKLIDSLRAHNRQKHLNLNEAYSLNNVLADDKADCFINFVTTHDDPEKKVIALDETRVFLQELMNGFSDLELKVFRYHYLIGMKQREITQHLGVSSKSLDNAIQRIRRKVMAYRDREVAG